MAIINGDSGDNELLGTETADTIRGYGGDDELYGFGGDDRIYGGGGHDWLFGGNGNDRLEGGAGDDLLHGELGNDILLGGDGNDDLQGGGGTDELRGGAGDDGMSVWGEGSVAWGEGGNDEIWGDGTVTLRGGAGDDFYRTYGSDVTVIEGAGQGIDRIWAHANIDMRTTPNVENLQLWGEATLGIGNNLNNLMISTADEAVTMNGGAGNDTFVGNRYAAGETFIGGAGRDTFHADSYGGNNILDFVAGTDKIYLGYYAFNLDDADVGRLPGSRFYAGTEAQTEDHRIIWDASTGSLYYDPDGTGYEEMRLVFNLDGITGQLSANDFRVGADFYSPS